MDSKLPTLVAQNLDPNKIGALGYRAPELFYGLHPHDTKSDMWSLGVVLQYLGGVNWSFQQPAEKPQWRKSYEHLVFLRLGYPPQEVGESFKAAGNLWFETLPKPRSQGQDPDPWPRSRNLGTAGDDLIRQLVQWDSDKRPAARDVANHAFSLPCLFEPSGWFLKSGWHDSGQHCSPTLEGVGPLCALRRASRAEASNIQGHRHHSCLRVGSVGTDLLRWLQEDEALQGTGIMDTIGAEVDQWREKIEKSADGRVIKRLCGFFAGSGFVQNGVASVKPIDVIGLAQASVNGFTLDRPLPLKRVGAFLEAFLLKNNDALMKIHSEMKKNFYVAKKPDAEERGHENVARFEQLWNWCLRAAEIHVTQPFWTTGGKGNPACAQGSRQEFFHEPRHNDGSSSILHASLTLFGRRDVHMEQSPDLPSRQAVREPRTFQARELDDFVVVNEPGTFYCGQVARGAAAQTSAQTRPDLRTFWTNGWMGLTNDLAEEVSARR